MINKNILNHISLTSKEANKYIMENYMENPPDNWLDIVLSEINEKIKWSIEHTNPHRSGYPVWFNNTVTSEGRFVLNNIHIDFLQSKLKEMGYDLVKTDAPKYGRFEIRWQDIPLANVSSNIY